MKIFHTSDWHIGRTFHGNSTLEHLGSVFDALVQLVIEQQVDVVVVAGDIFDSATPAAENYETLTRVLLRLREAGATVVLTSGNHDSASRLGFQSGFAAFGGVHVIARVEQHDNPVAIDDEHGPVHFYGIPYLEPSIIRSRYPEVELRTHEQALGFVMDGVRRDLAARGGRSVVLSHVFTSNVEASGPERDITSGGLDIVPVSVFDGPDYVALGHIHGRATLSERVRYSGAPLHYSFSEAGKARGGWLVTLDAAGLAAVEWFDLPVPRRLTVLTGELDALLTDVAHAEFEEDWISAVLTDQVRPMDAMRRLQTRFPFAATLEHRPTISASDSATNYGERIRARSDDEIVDGFLGFVRNGKGATEAERAIIADAIATQRAAEVGS